MTETAALRPPLKPSPQTVLTKPSPFFLLRKYVSQQNTLHNGTTRLSSLKRSTSCRAKALHCSAMTPPKQQPSTKPESSSPQQPVREQPIKAKHYLLADGTVATYLGEGELDAKNAWHDSDEPIVVVRRISQEEVLKIYYDGVAKRAAEKVKLLHAQL